MTFAAVLLACFAAIAPAFGQQPVYVTETIQRWADADGNDILEPREIDALLAASLHLLTEPHESRTPLDELLDFNRDGMLGPEEIEWAWLQIVLPRMYRLSDTNLELARTVDLDLNGRLTEAEANAVLEYLYFDGALRTPHRSTSSLDGRVDENHDGWISPEEIDGFRLRLVSAVVLMPFSLAGPHVSERRVAGTLDELADLDGDGILNAEEIRIRTYGLEDPHLVLSDFDRRLDTNGDGRVEADEIERARRLDEIGAGQAVRTTASPGGTTADAGAAEPAPTPPPAAAAAALSGSAASEAASRATTAAVTGYRVALEQVSIDEIFPVFRSYYNDHPIGTATLKNAESVPLENLKVELKLERVMDARKPCSAPTRLDAGASADIELMAVFNEKVLELTEATKALATITVSCTAGGQPLSREFVETVQFLDRNAMTWDDDDRAAAFVTRGDSLVQQFRSAAVTNVDRAVAAVDLKLRTAMALYHALTRYGLKYWTDPNAAYRTVRASKAAIDYLQFPAQTLQLKTGDCDDLSILVCALLESASIETAFITIPGHIYVAFALATKAEDVPTYFPKSRDRLIMKNGKAWVPWEVTSLAGGFLKAWETGATEWRQCDDAQRGFHPVKDAWQKYAAVQAPTTSIAVSLPAEADWTKAYTEEVRTFIDQEIAAQVSRLQADISKNKTKPEYVNSLGVLYARYGLSVEAEKELLKLEKQEYVPALINLGNLAFLAGDMKKALTYYERAVKKDPKNARALLGVARASHELANYGTSQEAYAKLKKVDPELASRYAYLELQGVEATRAASAAEVTGHVAWDDWEQQ